MSIPKSKTRLDDYRERILTGNIIVVLLRLGTPQMVAQLANIAYSVMNSLWLSLFSENAIAVPRQVFPVQMFYSAAINALNVAGTSLVSQYIGARMYSEVRRESSRILTASVVIGACISAAFFVTRPLVFTYVVSTPPEIYGYTMDYTALTSLNILLASSSMALTTVLVSAGETRLPSTISMVSVAVNSLLDPVFILGLGPFPRMGPAGSALTDTIGLSISNLLLLHVFRRRLPELMPRFARDFSPAWVKLVIRIGGPVALMSCLNSLAFMTQLRLVNAFGVNVATAYAIGFLVLDIADAALWGLSGAIAVIVGQCIGAGERRRAKEGAFKCALFVSSLVALGAGALYVVKPAIVSFFSQNPEVVSESLEFLDTILLGLPFFAFFMSGFSAARGAGRTFAATAINIGRLWLVRVGLSYVLAFPLNWGSQGVWTGIMLSNVVGASLMAIWLSTDWAKPVIANNLGGG